MKKRIFALIVLIVLSGFASSLIFFNLNAAGSSQKNSVKITEREFVPFKYPMTFIVRYSSVIYDDKGKSIIIPIFQGNYGEIKYRDLINYSIEKKYIDQNMWISYIIKCQKGKIKQTLHDFLNFYKSNILKDVDVKNIKNASLTSTEWTIRYDFKIDNVPCYLEIQFDPKEEDVDNETKYSSIYDINPEENVKDPNILYTFVVGAQ